ncbi:MULTISPECIES: acyl-CoA dehydrogenase family protein [unclassified Mucilaginibacter]|uniref:acyl-CoA dehydrogenase family protein n=1 Tax=unclassified Mucilaginibacter TaxID=2617802 RepID=UPI000962EB0F|nr:MULTISPECIES: acyl-CoA dehydrogenase family protein [unclassified Mucilaginibacter]OJW16888.1 MAG: acyl-CoA dehydrogenase [Mucilaginibacter sp. 44-25]PLW91565.1 MAG: acyl-CoA dehydrogenase [Mucilaginibacter sp.]HEK21873.1 acyl-CoA dehydrogenase [Bacteroidota bacterium]
MNFDITAGEQLAMIKQSAKEFAEQYIRPHVMDWDERQYFPADLFHQLGEYGFMGILVPEQYGGSGLDYQTYVTVIDEISQVCGSIGLSLAAHNSLCTNHILMFGNEEQKHKYLPKLASGQWIGAWGLTETGTGSDAGGMSTIAVKDGDHWVLNGSKNFITHAISGDVAVVIVRTGEKGDSHGMTAFVVEKGTPGFTAGKKENKMGMRASETACLFFDNCRVPAANVLGEVGDGFIQSLKVLDGGRISIAALSLGIAKGAYKAAIAYAKEREQFGKPIAQFQAIAFKLADMATKIEAAELLIRKAGNLKDSGQKSTKLSAMAKYYASEICVEVANEGVQIHGGYGYTKDYPAEKYYRDAKLCTIGEGTSEIQKVVISRLLMEE